ncbi:DNA gyrase subunit A, partial [Klebsiella pneumoniae]|uniref:DNA gyrase C-terminal beta-propeller domain-containing protein n=1 Tax=Klebsiella pneumoniae TaxID=573 RepID=UPI000FEDB81F
GPDALGEVAGDHVLLTTALGQCIRFPVDDVRVFAGRNSVGVRGINLGAGDRIISMTIVSHVNAGPWERAAYLKRAAAERRALTGETDAEEIALVGEEVTEEGHLTEERYQFLKSQEQFVLTVSEKGFGKRSSSYDFRTSGRGGKGIR